MLHLIVLVHCLLASIPWRNVHMLCCGCRSPRGETHQNGYLRSCWKHEILSLPFHWWQGSQAIVCTCQLLFSVACVCLMAMELRAIRTIMSTAHAYYNMLPTICWMHLILFASSFGISSGERGLLRWNQNFWVRGSRGIFASSLGQDVHILVFSSWCTPAWRCQQFCWHNPNQGISHNTGLLSNPLLMSMLSLILQSSAWRRRCLCTWHQSCQPWVWTKLGECHGTKGQACSRIHGNQMEPVSVEVTCWPIFLLR